MRLSCAESDDAVANHYLTLGVPRSAARAEIVRAYRRLARRHHPDVGGDPERFCAVQAAYEVLAEPRLRLLYDVELDRLAPKPPPQPARSSAPPAGHRPEPAPTRLRPPSPASCTLALLLAGAALVAAALPSLLVAGVDRRFGAAIVSLVVGIALARTACARARTQLERTYRSRMLWSCGFARPAPGAQDEAARCEQLAALANAVASLVARGAVAVSTLVTFAAMRGSLLP